MQMDILKKYNSLVFIFIHIREIITSTSVIISWILLHKIRLIFNELV